VSSTDRLFLPYDSPPWFLHRIAYYLFLLPVMFLCCLDLFSCIYRTLVPYKIDRVLMLYYQVRQYTKLRLWPTPRSLLRGPTCSYNTQLRRGGYHKAWGGAEGGFERGFKSVQRGNINASNAPPASTGEEINKSKVT
jgi:hypothetical protein